MMNLWKTLALISVLGLCAGSGDAEAKPDLDDLRVLTVAIGPRAVEQILPTDDGHWLYFYSRRDHGNEMRLIRVKAGEKRLQRLDTIRVYGIKPERRHKRQLKEDQPFKQLTADLRRQTAELHQVRKIELSAKAPSYLVSYISFDLTKDGKTLEACLDHSIAHYKGKIGYAIIGFRHICETIARPEQVTAAAAKLMAASKAVTFEPQDSTYYGWRDFRVSPLPTKSTVKSWRCDSNPGLYQFALGVNTSMGGYQKACVASSARQYDATPRFSTCESGMWAGAALYINETRNDSEGGIPYTEIAVRFPGRLETATINVNHRHAKAIASGATSLALPEGEFRAACLGDKVVVTDTENPCAVYDIPLAKERSYFGDNVVTLRPASAACTKLEKQLLAKAKVAEQQNPCSVEKLEKQLEAALVHYQAKMPDLALNTLVPATKSCLPTLANVEALATKVYSDLSLYALRNGRGQLCSELHDEFRSLHPYAKVKSLDYNVGKCRESLYQVSTTIKLDAPARQDNLCDQLSGPRYRIGRNSDGEFYLQNPQDEETRHQVPQAVRLSSKSGQDLIAYLGMCGNRGDCMWGAFVNCGPRDYVAVFEDYTEDLKVLNQTHEAQGANWHDLSATEINRQTGVQFAARLEFNGQRYEATKAERGRVSALFERLHKRNSQ